MEARHKSVYQGRRMTGRQEVCARRFTMDTTSALYGAQIDDTQAGIVPDS